MSGLQMKYFVLKPAGSSPYARASRAAMRAYARQIEPMNKELASDLMEWAYKESMCPTIEEHQDDGKTPYTSF